MTIGCHPVQGQVLPGCSISGEDIYFKGKMLVSNGVVVATDRLGSVRKNSQGESFAYFPYGEERTSTANGRDKFGTYFRDSAGQDYADQRYFGSDKGRFWSVDPAGSGLNRYAYAGGDPVNAVDPTGTSYHVLCVTQEFYKGDDTWGSGEGCWGFWDRDRLMPMMFRTGDGGGGGDGGGVGGVGGYSEELLDLTLNASIEQAKDALSKGAVPGAVLSEL